MGCMPPWVPLIFIYLFTPPMTADDQVIHLCLPKIKDSTHLNCHGKPVVDLCHTLGLTPTQLNSTQLDCLGELSRIVWPGLKTHLHAFST